MSRINVGNEESVEMPLNSLYSVCFGKTSLKAIERLLLRVCIRHGIKINSLADKIVASKKLMARSSDKMQHVDALVNFAASDNLQLLSKIDKLKEGIQRSEKIFSGLEATFNKLKISKNYLEKKYDYYCAKYNKGIRSLALAKEKLRAAEKAQKNLVVAIERDSKSVASILSGTAEVKEAINRFEKVLENQKEEGKKFIGAKENEIKETRYMLKQYYEAIESKRQSIKRLEKKTQSYRLLGDIEYALDERYRVDKQQSYVLFCSNLRGFFMLEILCRMLRTILRTTY